MRATTRNRRLSKGAVTATRTARSLEFRRTQILLTVAQTLTLALILTLIPTLIPTLILILTLILPSRLLVALFGVFDGHGGVAAADYCANNMMRFLRPEVRTQGGDWPRLG